MHLHARLKKWIARFKHIDRFFILSTRTNAKLSAVRALINRPFVSAIIW